MNKEEGKNGMTTDTGRNKAYSKPELTQYGDIRTLTITFTAQYWETDFGRSQSRSDDGESRGGRGGGERGGRE